MLLLICALFAPPVDWVRIRGGQFEPVWNKSRPQGLKTVTVKTFYMSRTEVTVAQYAACVAAKVCAPPKTFSSFACERPEARPDHPRDCVRRADAETYARWVGGDLPTWFEWTYAARSRGKTLRRRWGNDDATCENTVLNPKSGPGGWSADEGCGRSTSWPVCSKPAGNTEQGLCDMGGNVQEIVRSPYADVPSRFQMTLGGSLTSQIGGISLTLALGQATMPIPPTKWVFGSFAGRRRLQSRASTPPSQTSAKPPSKMKVTSESGRQIEIPRTRGHLRFRWRTTWPRSMWRSLKGGSRNRTTLSR